MLKSVETGADRNAMQSVWAWCSRYCASSKFGVSVHVYGEDARGKAVSYVLTWSVIAVEPGAVVDYVEIGGMLICKSL